MPGDSLTWLGHAAFRIDSPGGKRIYLDPWLTNPSAPDGAGDVERIDILALTHGHNDHVGETVDLCRRFSPSVVAMNELADWLETSQGIEGASGGGMNKGGTQEVDGIRFTMTNAVHSSGFTGGSEPVYLGDPAGFVFVFENGTTVYFAGDTAVFSDMSLIGRIYSPEVAVLPIGDHFTMGPREAAVALELLGVRRCVPCHYGTFPVLAGSPDELRGLTDVELVVPEPGETVEL